ncbi:MAG: 3-phosphoshikimate 1-carboxyvinyltransferase [Isosphaeraceae bacterium]|jgi:3-phosphoshikimate 1-carboxyvinyltransferase|nr:MAG: 3-phosphoshikimate 1-carboxyvinyltransferase [Isosphaeraceae bacterium]
MSQNAGPAAVRLIEPLLVPPRSVSVRVPGSKSLTNRALVVAALAEGRSILTGVLESQDTRVMIEGLRGLGFALEEDAEAGTVGVDGQGGRVPAASADLFVGNSGTTMRFLSALAALGHGRYRLDGTARMRERPLGDLLLALNRLGADARSEARPGCPPVTIRADGLTGGYVHLRGDVSSQFLSALLMVLPRAEGPTTIDIDGPLVSQPYVAMTLGVMEAFGVRISNHGFRRFTIEPAPYQARRYAIEPDASAASYWFAAAAITGGSVAVEGLGTSSIQGDLAFVDVLEHMGCRVERSPSRIEVAGGPLQGIDVDMNAISDTMMTLAAVAVFAHGPTRIRNVAHVRHKETDRIAAVATELRKLGAEVIEYPDGLLILPPERIKPASIATYDDHRMAMAFALVGLRAEGVAIEDPDCVAKTYPGFWDDLERLRASA